MYYHSLVRSEDGDGVGGGIVNGGGMYRAGFAVQIIISPIMSNI